jgi:mannose-6-phosphate isomerase-like protein (cupin superfamily)
MAQLNLLQETLQNNYFRKVLVTSKSMQIVVMSITNDIPLEIHEISDQFFMVVDGEIEVYMSGSKEGPFTLYNVKSGQSIIVPNNTWHYVRNIKTPNTKLYTIYSPPHHDPHYNPIY